jgi:hypothetical protein
LSEEIIYKSFFEHNFLFVVDLKRDPLAAAVKPHGWLAEEMSRAVHHINVSKTNATK